MQLATSGEHVTETIENHFLLINKLMNQAFLEWLTYHLKGDLHHGQISRATKNKIYNIKEEYTKE